MATYKALAGRLFASSWWKGIDADLERRGFRPATPAQVRQTESIHVQVLSPNLVRMDRGGCVDHVMIGTIHGYQARTFLVRLRGGYHWIDAPAAAVKLPAAFAPTTIRRARRGVRPVGLKRALFELGSFNRAVDVRSEDTYFASALVDARMIAWLSDNLDRCVIEVADGWAVAWSNSLLGAMRSPTELLDVLQRFAERIPNSVRSLFPRGDRPEMGWVHSRPRKGVSALIDRISEEPSGSPTTPGD